MFNEPPYDKTNKMTVRPAKTDQPGHPPVWSESSLSAWWKFGSLATHWAHNEDSDQTGRMPRLIWVFAGRTVIVLVLSWGSSVVFCFEDYRRACLKLRSSYSWFRNRPMSRTLRSKVSWRNLDRYVLITCSHVQVDFFFRIFSNCHCQVIVWCI